MMVQSIAGGHYKTGPTVQCVRVAVYDRTDVGYTSLHVGRHHSYLLVKVALAIGSFKGEMFDDIVIVVTDVFVLPSNVFVHIEPHDGNRQ